MLCRGEIPLIYKADKCVKLSTGLGSCWVVIAAEETKELKGDQHG